MNPEEKIQQSPEPYWRESVNIQSFPKVQEDLTADIVIVGGGITGITAAYQLTKQGKNVVLIEANQLFNGTTGHTTAKVTAQHGLIYDELIQHFGNEIAKLYYKANDEAITFIKDTINSLGIECDLTEEDAYVYSTTEKYEKKIEKEYEAYKQLKIEGDLVEQLPIDLNIKNAVVMKNQAQFHPLQYLTKLVEEITKNGGKIYGDTIATDIREGDQPQVQTRDGNTITCNTVLICSHFPFYDGMGLYFTKMYAERSYVLGAKTRKDYPGGMYLSAEDPTRSIRYTNTSNGKLILFGGDNHKTGQGKDTLEHYKALETFGEEVLGIEEVKYKWSAQDLITVDKVPYIGQHSSKKKNIYVATGYKKWGMTSSTVAATLLTDLIIKKSSPYEEVFQPSRFVADPSIKHFIKENADVARHLVKGKLEIPMKTPDDLRVDEGDVVNINGIRGGGYRDEDGKLHLVDTTCTHLGCECEWNHGDRTWDCPCHGSRYSINGDVIEGPAEKPLKRLD
ncbi:glycine/D-amino acid oxidase-like deaminating enzyme/nitrite reductase/ring-hydroxylating ferredoxin subunit [Bacillus pakistanensis]|uniref:Glycine/D-amino acid oxidase-like deaminating enzyme/nitrite reductase/ring-hydroxylating ferredoxin subunit n=1 Tax=Rossellomorea pakistanensis TaxID=992288 RepID=A0ABS2NBG0_9BACI|nr:FAD-dependent oxidoreductase [Bacillus pakistanensis]MBM7585150.1 glycine/D-amino acid oxidase-like deaminating enzyme/nitrite reductase/ring-hydroxylating ferredoxin subunit [Bacillus pakistanensis]